MVGATLRTQLKRTLHSAIRKQLEDCRSLLVTLGLDRIKDVLCELCREAENLEPNDDIRRLIRLTKRYRIERIKGRLGGSVYLLSMAEMIRRAAETAFETELPEEDEFGYGGGKRPRVLSTSFTVPVDC